jgi:hypothetical protein
VTPNDKSLTKARYFRSILRVARPLDEALALRMLKSLVNDTTTDGVAGNVLQAEQTALDAARKLLESLQTRESNAVASWNRASDVVTRWLNLVA